MLCKFQKTKAGFSLMELLIVVAITLIMTGVVLAKKNTSKAQTEVEAAARQVAAQIRSLQNEALNGKQIGTAAVCSYKLDFVVGALTYSKSYHSDCLGAVLLGSAQTFNLSSKKNVQVSALSGTSFYFSSPRGALSAPQQIILESKGQPATKASVCIYGSGNILEKKDDTAC